MKTFTLHRLALIFSFLICSLSMQAQNFSYAWTVSGGSTGVDEGRGVTTDSLKNVFVVGSFTGTVDFNPGLGLNTLTATGTGSGYLVKYDPNGNFLWVLMMSGSVSASGTSICSDNANNIYVIGEINGTSGDFDPGPGVSTITSFGQTDVYVAKYTSTGQFEWLQQFGGTLNEYARKVKMGKHDELLITCNFEGTVDFDPGPGTNNITSAGSSDVFIARLRSNGTLDWVKTIGNAGGNQGPSIGVDEYGGVYSVGSFSGTLDTNPDITATNFLTASGTSSDAILIKLDSNGIFQWSYNLGSNSAAIINDVQPDGDNNIFLTGWFAGSVDFDPGSGLDTMTNISGIDAFLWKMTYNGSHSWARRIGNSLPEFYDGRSIQMDKFGNPYVLGVFEGSADFDPGVGIKNEVSMGDFDSFIWGLTTNGSYLFSKSVGGTGKEVSPDLHIDDENNIYFTGFFTAQVDFNPWAGTNLISPASLVADYHVNKWKYCIPTAATVVDSTCNKTFLFNGQTYTNSGIYTQTSMNVNGCDSVITLDLTLINIDTTTSLSAPTLTSLQSGATYQWYNCKGTWSIIAGATQQSYTATQNGQYAVVITYKGCSDTSNCLTVVGVGLDHWAENNFCTIYPNPSSGDIYFDWSSISFERTIYIYNSVGQLLDKIPSSGQLQTKIHLNQAPGHYVIKIKTKEGDMIVPLILN